MNIPAAYYINLDSRTDRRIRFEEHWKGIFNKPIERFSAIRNSHPSNSNEGGIRGCGASHAKLILQMEKTNLPYIIVFEDDAEQTEHFATAMPQILEYIESNLDKWNIVNCGTNTIIGLHPEVHAPPTIKYITAELFSTTIWSNTQMMIYGRGVIPIARKYLDLMAAGKIPMSSHYSHNDVYFSTHPNAKSLITSYQLTSQYVDWSDNQEIISDQRGTFARAAADLQQLRTMFASNKNLEICIQRPQRTMLPHPSSITCADYST